MSKTYKSFFIVILIAILFLSACKTTSKFESSISQITKDCNGNAVQFNQDNITKTETTLEITEDISLSLETELSNSIKEEIWQQLPEIIEKQNVTMLRAMQFYSNGWIPSKVFELKLAAFQPPTMPNSKLHGEMGKLKTFKQAEQKAREKQYIAEFTTKLCDYKEYIKQSLLDKQNVFMSVPNLKIKDCTNLQGALERIARFGNYSNPHLVLLITDGQDSCGQSSIISNPGENVTLVVILLPIKNEKNAQFGFQQRKQALQSVVPWATIISPSEIDNLLKLFTRSKTSSEQLIGYNH